MAQNRDDPKLTAYALGELDEAEAKEVEARLAEDEAARQYVQETRDLAERLTEELRREPAPALSEAQRKVVVLRAKQKPGRTTWRRLRLAAAIVAGLVVAGVLIGLLTPTLARAREEARRGRGSKSRSRLAACKNDLSQERVLWSSTNYASKALQHNMARLDGRTIGSSTPPQIFHELTEAPPAPEPWRSRSGPHNTEAYDTIVENPFKRVADDPLSTFSIDVDTASYANVRRFLSAYQRPPKGAVRIEELINYFKYDYAPPTDGEPFAAHVEISDCPWNLKHRLIRIGLKGKVPPRGERPPCNLVFLLDVSGSMNQANKLPLVRESMKTLVDGLRDADSVAIVVYAGASGLVLDSTPCTDKARIVGALDRLKAGGSTNGGAGIRLAYSVAQAHFIPKGVNRVILCTDGDFNVGTTDRSSLVGLIKKKAKSGVFLTVLGFGMGNYKDGTLEQLADKGNGAYGYVDTLREAKKLFVDQLEGTLITIAKDVKIQVEFNPARVAAYRLIGYENRMLRHQDFNDDTKDAGEIGAGHTVTALYEIIPAGRKVDVPGVAPLKYQKPLAPTKAADSGEVMTLKLRYKQPDGDKSKLMVAAVKDTGEKLDKASRDFKFTASVAMFGLVLRDSKYKGTATLDGVIELAGEGKGPDKKGYRAEFIGLAKKAKAVLKK